MGSDDAVKALRKMRIEGSDLVDVLSACGISTEALEAALAKSSKTGVGFVGKL